MPPTITGRHGLAHTGPSVPCVFARIHAHYDGHAFCNQTGHDALPPRALPKAAILTSRPEHGEMGTLHRESPRDVRLSLVGLRGQRRRKRPRGHIERSGRYRGAHGRRVEGLRRGGPDPGRGHTQQFIRQRGREAWGHRPGHATHSRPRPRRLERSSASERTRSRTSTSPTKLPMEGAKIASSSHTEASSTGSTSPARAKAAARRTTTTRSLSRTHSPTRVGRGRSSSRYAAAR